MKKISQKIVRLLGKKKFKISFAESCTGGLLSSTITQISGSSKVFTIGKGPFKDTYKSDVKYNKKEDSIFVTNLEGPLKHLKNTWNFKEENNMTEISFEVDFELKNEFLNIVMTKSFQFALDKIAEAFQKRAEDLFKKT